MPEGVFYQVQTSIAARLFEGRNGQEGTCSHPERRMGSASPLLGGVALRDHATTDKWKAAANDRPH